MKNIHSRQSRNRF